MKTMKKIVAILAVAMMLFSILPLSAFAAETSATITFDNTSKRTEYSTSKQVWVENGITVTNNKSASTSNVGNYSKPARFYKSSQLIVEYPGMTKIEFDCNSTSYATALKNSISGATVSVSSDKVTVTFAEPVDSFTISSLTGGQVRMDGLTVTYTEGAANPECDHDSLTCGDTCEACGETKEHEYDNNCDADCANGCGITNPNYADHVYDGNYDVACNVCGGEREVNFPEADSTLTIVEANTIGGGMTHNTYTPNKYYVTGVIESISNTTYGNMYIVDEDGNKLSIYGTYSADGKTQFGSMEEKPVVGMTITVYGVIGYYSTAAQMKNGWITEMISNCEHVWDNNCDTTCDDCGFVRVIEHDYIADVIESTCTEHGSAAYECSVCGSSYDEELPLADHNYVNDVCTACGAQKPTGYAPITSAEQFVSGEYVMVVSSGYAPTYYDNGNNPWVLTGQPVISDEGIIAAEDAAGFLWTLTVDGNTVTITDANGVTIAPKSGNNNGIQAKDYAWAWTFEDGKFIFAGVGSDTTYLASNTATGDSGGLNRFRAYKTTTVNGNTKTYLHQFTLYAATVTSAPACEHEYDNACDVDCNLCYETREVSHNVIHVEAAAATCAANGNIEYWYCDVCGMAWLDAECTLNTNLRAVVLPATGEHTYFDACSAICEVCGYEREVSHNVIHVEAVAATCVANGNIEYWYCDVCGAAWLDAECTLNTNLRAVITPATGEHTYDDEYDADCNVCGDIREVPEKPVDPDEILYGDANGDGDITLLDAGMLSQYVAGFDVALSNEAAADVNGDGDITLLDAGMLSQYVAGFDVTLGPVEEEEEKLFNDGKLAW